MVASRPPVHSSAHTPEVHATPSKAKTDEPDVPVKTPKKGKSDAEDGPDVPVKPPKKGGGVTAGQVAAGAAVLAVVGFTADAAYNLNASNNTPRQITKVEKTSDGITITFTPVMPIMSSDILDITGSKTVPSIDATGITPSSVDSDKPNQVVIDSKDLTSFTAGGSIKVTSSLTAQSGYLAASAGGAVGKTGGDFFKGLFDFKTPGGKACIGVIIAIAALMVIFSLYKAFKK